MTTGQTIAEKRKAAGLTQEELAEKLNVSRQAVSKWELDAAYPETENIVELCKLFSISADELLLGKPAAPNVPAPQKPRSFFDELTSFHYEYTSKLRLGGLPLLHINFGLGAYRAKGVFAVGTIATGLVSLGFLSFGVLAFGMFALGLAALGCMAIGGASFGAFAFGALAFGAIVVGVISYGGIAVGYVSTGGVAIGQYAVGDIAKGFCAVAKTRAEGPHAFIVPDGLGALEAFLFDAPPLIRRIILLSANGLSV